MFCVLYNLNTNNSNTNEPANARAARTGWREVVQYQLRQHNEDVGPLGLYDFL